MRDAALHPAYVLHARPYRESSLLLDLLVLGQGRVGAVARGVRGARSSARRAALQPLQPLLVSLLRRGELFTLVRFEPASQPLSLRGEALMAALYVNELCQRMLPRDVSDDDVFLRYANCLAVLADGAPAAEPLRHLEAALLEATGYGFDLGHDDSGQPVRSDARYWLADSGALLRVDASARPAVSGLALRALAEGMPLPQQEAAALRRLLRARIASVLGPRPLRCWGLLDELAGLGMAQSRDAASSSDAHADSKA